tara:strand:+ start:1047 stop:1505 length:459 start_codon:yes stop_codon:yes gene_type:complete
MVKHEGWKYFQGINHERLKKGKIDEIKIYKKIKEIDFLPCECEPTKAWNNQSDFKNNDLNISIEIKRRFKYSFDEFPFNKRKNTLSTLITFKKYQHLRENNGWLYIQYNDKLYMLQVEKITKDDFIVCHPFGVKHVSINIACFKNISSEEYE